MTKAYNYRRDGVVPSQGIRWLIESGAISAESEISDGQVQPASLDLRLGDTAHRIRASFLGNKRQEFSERITEHKMHTMSLKDGAVLERGCVYLIPLMERLKLPKDLIATANAKSSTGRLDLFTRLITETGTEFDRVGAEYEGKLYAEICPRSFSVLVRPGLTLNQIRFRYGNAEVSDVNLKELHNKEGLVDEEAHIDGGLSFSVDLETDKSKKEDAVKVKGYKAKPHSRVINLEKIKYYEVSEFWDPVIPHNNKFILDPGAFYILASREAIHIPPKYAAEMAPYTAMAGEFRVHYAGFFDPGFGHTPNASNSSPANQGKISPESKINGHSLANRSRGVLEVRCHEAPFVLEHEQIVGRLVYELMQETSEVLYGQGLKSNYQGQGLKLSKHFKDP